MKLLIFSVLVALVCLIGEVKCVIKMINCNFDPIGKAEIFYSIGTFTGAGAVIGWFDIKDN